MENTVLWSAFSSLNNLERKHLGQWLASPFFCRRDEPLLLFQYLQQCYAKDRVPDTREAQAAGRAARLEDFRLLMSELLGQIEHFLVYKEFFLTETAFHIRLAAAYRKRGQGKHFERALRNARRLNENQPHRNTEYFETRAEIEYEQYRFLSAGSRTEALNLQALFDATDHTFISRKLRQACFALSHQAVYKAEYRLGLFETVLDYVRISPQLLQVPAIALYYYCYQFLTEPDQEDYFRHFKAMLFQYFAVLPVDEQRDLHLLAINYCIRKINESELQYMREAFDLYQSALKGDLLLENGLLSHFAFNNIVACALHVGETQWAEDFILQHAGFLEKKHREANVQLNLARVAYVQKRYRKALLHLQEADYKDLINNLIAKTLLMKIYFETGELDVLEAHLQSMQTFLRRQRVIGYHKTNFQNMIRYARKLMNIHPSDKKERELLAVQVTAEKTLSEKEWLLEMLK